MEEVKEQIKKVLKKLISVKIAIAIVAILLIIIIITGSTYVIMKWIAEKVPQVASKYTSSISIANDGTVSSSMSSRQVWNEMTRAGYEIENYLDGPDDLERLLNAELVTQIPDMREDVTKEIDWEALRAVNKEKQSKIDSSKSDRELNILFIGDSKTNANNLPNMFEQLSKSLGKSKVHADSTEHNWDKATLSSFIDNEEKLKDLESKAKERKWDYIVLQQESSESLKKEKTSESVKKIIDYMKENNNEHINVIYDAWGNDMSYDTEKYGQVMQTFIKTKQDNGGAIAYIANQLVAFHDKYPDVQLDNGDGINPNVSGSYLAACSTYKAIFGQKTEGATYKAGLSDDLAKNIQKCVDESDATNALGNEIQGIIKFKRHDENGNSFYLTYADPTEFNMQMRIYNNSGSAESKDFMLKHFTLKEKPKDGSSSSGVINGTGSFTKYNFSDQEIKEIANLCNDEQPGPEGAAAEASLMANLFELKGSASGEGKDGLYNYIRNSGWFKNTPGCEFMNYDAMKIGESTDEQVQAVKAVLVQGYRTLPKYVDEHDTLSPNFQDIGYVENNGQTFDKMNKSQYQPHVTVIHQGGGLTGMYTFFCFPSEGCDPFGYTNSSLREQYGDFCYEYGTWKAINGTEDQNATDVHATSSGSTAGASEMGQKLVDFVKDKLGMEYVRGGRGGESGGYDCSNLTSCAYETVGITISGNDQDQYEDPQFEHVPVEQAVPGDILWHQRTCWNVYRE